jgi:hypothetical protein
LRDANDAIQKAGGQVIAVGMGTPAMAADAAATGKLPFTLLVDPKMDLYRALEARRGGFLSMLSFEVLAGAFRAWRRGHRQSGVKGDPMQLGATAIADSKGEALALRLARDPADHPPIDWILDAIRSAAQTR